MAPPSRSCRAGDVRVILAVSILCSPLHAGCGGLDLLLPRGAVFTQRLLLKTDKPDCGRVVRDHPPTKEIDSDPGPPAYQGRSLCPTKSGALAI